MNNNITTIMNVKENNVRVMRVNNQDYISLTDLAKYLNSDKPANVIIHWMSNKATYDFIGLWEQLNNNNFNFTEFSEIKIKEVGYPSFTLSPKRWIQRTNAMGIITSSGKYSIGTFAHPDIAFEFASWLSSEFKLYLIKEFQRLKKNEAYQNKIEWNESRVLTKINYLVQTNSIKENIVPILTEKQKRYVYASEADVLNVALFGMTAKQWRDNNPNLKGNIRDYTDILHLIILNNLEVLNANMIESNISQSDRLIKLNDIARNQMILFKNNKSINDLKNKLE